MFFDTLRVEIRDDAVVRNTAVHIALGVLPDGNRVTLGILNPARALWYSADRNELRLATQPGEDIDVARCAICTRRLHPRSHAT